jgi:arsenite methyltransferase
VLQKTLRDIQDYYGQVLKTNADLKTSACCPLEAPPPRVQALLRNVHETVQAKFYGCGSPLPVAAETRTVLDLGCGSGRDAFILSQIVGGAGKVIGVDMTEEQLAVANQHVGWHMDKFGYDTPNVTFVRGYIEDLRSAGIADASVDIVISNCVINLSPDKPSVFKEIHRVLKPGGELYFSDIFASRRIPPELQHDQVIRGECLGGAMYIEDFRRMMRAIGILDYRTVSKRQLTLDDPEVLRKAGMIDFYSMTIRALKVDLEDVCENYGHVAWYRGSIPECPHSFILDDHHEFKTGQPVPVCGNTANMLAQTRYADHFRIDGDFSTHYGLFDCAPQATVVGAGGACC